MTMPREFQDTVLSHLPYAEGGSLADTDNLADLGLDSMGVVQLLGDLEDSFGLELPDELLTEDTFATAGSLWAAVADLVPADQFADA